MAKANIEIKIGFEKFVKLSCLNILCDHNLGKDVGYFCNLKKIRIGTSGLCLDRTQDPAQNKS